MSGGWFRHWLSRSHYNILMTNSMCTTVVEVPKIYSCHSYNGLMTANVKTNHMTINLNLM